MADQAEQVGLFPVGYAIGGSKIGSPLFTVHLVVFTPAETVTGVGHISQTTNPPLNIETKLDGKYTYMTVMPDNSRILVSATGYPIINWPPHGGIGPVILPNVELQMVLTGDWKSGTANYKYSDSNGKWHSITNAPVKFISSNVQELKERSLSR